MVNHDFLDIEYNGKLPMIIFTERGWLIQSDQYTNELLEEWMEWIKQGKRDPDMMYLKDRNREIIFLLLEKIKGSGNQSFIPYLELWKKIEYKKVQTEITKVITALEQNNPVDGKAEQERKKRIGEALEINEPQDLLLKCWICGDRFIFTVGEQQFHKKKGLSLPKRCGKCRHSYE
ncbi:zinc-ribbon domain containing protein [Pseudomonas sp. ISL-84]|nr:zinc-ribbon domain containing protein [Pseudomonas sp. ISL-84]